MRTDEGLARTESWVVDSVYRSLEITDALLIRLDIPYTIFGGTLLGAIRHGGMIPWDGDADVAVRAQDYPTLLAGVQPFLRERGYDITPAGHVRQIFALDSPRLGPGKHRYPADASFPRAKVDVFPMTKVDGRWVLSPAPLHEHWPHDYFEPDAFDHLHRIEFGPLRLSSVSDTVARRYLTTTYGPNWQTMAVLDDRANDNHSRQAVPIISFQPALPSWSAPQ